MAIVVAAAIRLVDKIEFGFGSCSVGFVVVLIAKRLVGESFLDR